MEAYNNIIAVRLGLGWLGMLWRVFTAVPWICGSSGPTTDPYRTACRRLTRNTQVLPMYVFHKGLRKFVRLMAITRLRVVLGNPNQGNQIVCDTRQKKIESRTRYREG